MKAQIFTLIVIAGLAASGCDRPETTTEARTDIAEAQRDAQTDVRDAQREANRARAEADHDLAVSRAEVEHSVELNAATRWAAKRDDCRRNADMTDRARNEAVRCATGKSGGAPTRTDGRSARPDSRSGRPPGLTNPMILPSLWIAIVPPPARRVAERNAASRTAAWSAGAGADTRTRTPAQLPDDQPRPPRLHRV